VYRSVTYFSEFRSPKWSTFFSNAVLVRKYDICQSPRSATLALPNSFVHSTLQPILLGMRLPTAEAAAKTGRTVVAVTGRRHVLGIRAPGANAGRAQ
jgi:hypothetical protein